LKRRYGGETQIDKYRMELKEERKKEESLEELHTNIRRLAVLTFPKMGRVYRECIACDCFIDALANPDLILQVRQQNPKTLDEALLVAQNLRYGRRRQNTFGVKRRNPKKTRELEKLRRRRSHTR